MLQLNFPNFLRVQSWGWSWVVFVALETGLVLGMMLGNIPPLRAEHERAIASEASAQSAASPQRLTPIRLQLKWKHQFQFAGYYAAKAKGYYQKSGLDVTFLEAPEDVEPAQLVLQGKAEFGIANSDILLLRARGNSVVVLAAIYQHSPLIFLALKQSGISNIHQLAGKRVMLEPHAEELIAYLKQEGISLEQITQIPHSFNTTALMDGKADAMSAYSTDEPFFLQQKGVPYLEFSPRSGGIDFYGETLFTTEAMIREHPREVREFLNASLLGWQYALKHPEEIVDLILRDYSQRHSRDHLLFEARESRQLIMPDVVEIGYMNPGRWQAIATIYRELGMLKSDFTLAGFLYERYPSPPWRWIYTVILSIGGVLFLVSFAALRFYRLQRSFKQEIQERKLVETELREAEQRFRLLAENTPFPVVISDLATSEILYINHKTAEKFEVSANFVVGKSTLDFYVNTHDREQIKQKLEHQGYLENLEIQLKTANGKPFWACVSMSLITFDGVEAALTAMMDITEQYNLKKRLAKLAMTDQLTNLHNRRYFLLQGNIEVKRSIRYNHPLSLLMIDLDHFKKVNDTYGHEVGDHVLQHIALLLRSVLREFDILGRLGGEEFTLLLPNTDQSGAYQLAERLRGLIEEYPYHADGLLIPLTVSIGLKMIDATCQTLDDLMDQADTALYQAKGAGRNRVVIAGEN